MGIIIGVWIWESWRLEKLLRKQIEYLKKIIEGGE
jgi:hypothetical protein